VKLKYNFINIILNDIFFLYLSIYIFILSVHNFNWGRRKYMVQIKVTPEMLEGVAKRAYSTRHALELTHKKLCDQIDHLCYQWAGASSQHFVQMFNDAKPKAFTFINGIANVEEELKQIAEKFRTADTSYDGNLVDGKVSDDNIEEGATCGPLSNANDPVKQEKSIFEKIVDGGWSGAGEAVTDTVDGFKSLGDAETWENLGNSLLHPIDTLKGMGQAVSESWDKDVVNGDAESRTKFFTYGLTQLAFGVLGDKGVSKVVKVAKGAKMSQGMTELPQLFNKGDNFAIAGGGGLRFGLDTPDFKQAEDTLLFFNPYKSHPNSIYKNNRTLEHIFHGNLNKDGDAGGYHHVSMMGEGEILRITKQPNKYGVYEAKVAVNGVVKRPTSTFFPDAWDRTQVLNCINEAYQNAQFVKGSTNTYIGRSANGMKIQMFIDKSTGRIISAFPIY